MISTKEQPRKSCETSARRRATFRGSADMETKKLLRSKEIQYAARITWQ